MAKKIKKWSLFGKQENYDKRSKEYKIFNGVERKKEKRIGPITLPQAIQQARFGLVNKTIAEFTAIWPIANQYKPKRDRALSMMFKQVYKNALRGDFPDFYIDYSVISISRYSATFINDADIIAADDGRCTITCELEAAQLRDLTMERAELTYFVLNTTKHVAEVYPGSCRKIELTEVLQAPAYSKGDELHVWIFLNLKTRRKMLELGYGNTVLFEN